MLKLLLVEGKVFYLYLFKVELIVDQDNDWFDFKGQVMVGVYIFFFMKLAKYICDGIWLFFLFDGQFFFILQEWMACYKGLF